MKKQDAIKVMIAVGCLVIAGVLFFMINSGGSGSPGGGQSAGVVATGGGGSARMTEDEVRNLADQTEGAEYGGTGPIKPEPRR